MQWAKKQSGFTIVELLIVVVVIAILAAITIVAYNGIRDRADRSALQSELASAGKKIETAKAQGGVEQYPLTLSDAGVTSTAITYSTNMSSNRSEYCATATKGSMSFYITNRTGAPAAGDCRVSNGLVGQWRFSGNANDSAGTNNGSVANATLTTGQNQAVNDAYSFNGSNAYIAVNTPSIERTSFSVSLWFRTSVVGDKKLISTNASSSLHIIQLMSPGVLRSCLGTASCILGTTPVVDGAWHFVSVVGSPDGARVYLDGSSTPEFTVDYSGSGSIGTQFRIGTDYVPQYFFSGQVDDVRMYGRSLSVPETQVLYSAGAQ